jgi:hypothetical protein
MREPDWVITGDRTSSGHYCRLITRRSLFVYSRERRFPTDMDSVERFTGGYELLETSHWGFANPASTAEALLRQSRCGRVGTIHEQTTVRCRVSRLLLM